MNVQAALQSQYHAALAMLKQAIDQCPDDLWTGGDYPVAFWRVAYHALFYTHLYLQPNEKAFRPWEHHRDEGQFLGALPWPPHRQAKIGQPYTKAQLIDYWRLCDELVNAAVDRLDLDAQECGFPWYRLPNTTVAHWFFCDNGLRGRGPGGGGASRSTPGPVRRSSAVAR
jgi:hypothetical protein